MTCAHSSLIVIADIFFSSTDLLEIFGGINLLRLLILFLPLLPLFPLRLLFLLFLFSSQDVFVQAQMEEIW